MAATTVRRSVLIVDDHADTREGYATYLKWVGYSPTEAASGEAALAAIGEVPPDLIVMDVRLQGISGLTVLAQLRSRPATRAIPVILLTGSDLSEHDRRGPAVAGFLQKPVTPDALAATIDGVFRARRRPRSREGNDGR
jgi:CheY-like chemotaxis protein